MIVKKFTMFIIARIVVIKLNLVIWYVFPQLQQQSVQNEEQVCSFPMICHNTMNTHSGSLLMDYYFKPINDPV